MTTAQLLIVCITALAGLLVIIAGRRTPDAGRTPSQPPSGGAVVVHTLDQRSIRGVVADASDSHTLKLRTAEYLVAGDAQPMGGLVSVPAANLAVVQELSAQEPKGEPAQ